MDDYVDRISYALKGIAMGNAPQPVPEGPNTSKPSPPPPNPPRPGRDIIQQPCPSCGQTFAHLSGQYFKHCPHCGSPYKVQGTLGGRKDLDIQSDVPRRSPDPNTWSPDRAVVEFAQRMSTDITRSSLSLAEYLVREAKELARYEIRRMKDRKDFEDAKERNEQVQRCVHGNHQERCETCLTGMDDGGVDASGNPIE